MNSILGALVWRVMAYFFILKLFGESSWNGAERVRVYCLMDHDKYWVSPAVAVKEYWHQV